jgi:hypothetical protein
MLGLSDARLLRRELFAIFAAKAAIADADARETAAQLALEKFKVPRTLTLEQQARITAAVLKKCRSVKYYSV